MKLLIFSFIQKITFSRIFWNKRKNIYLSFDDGPHPQNTPIILDILDKFNARATFFVVGEDAEKNIEVLKKVSDAGHTIANHSYSHIRYENNLMEFMEDVARCEDVLHKAKIPTKNIFRVPYGTVSLKLFIRLLRNGYKIAFWNKDTKDYKLEKPDDVSDHMDIHRLENGDVVLLHDYPDVTPKILENILTIHSDKKFVQM